MLQNTIIIPLIDTIISKKKKSENSFPWEKLQKQHQVKVACGLIFPENWNWERNIIVSEADVFPSLEKKEKILLRPKSIILAGSEEKHIST